MSARHAQEVERVLDDFKNRFGLDRIFLIGTSRGTVSAAYLALRLANKIDGVVLAATVFSRSRTGPGLDGFNFGRIPVPLLFIHHRHDACTVTPPAAAEQISTRFPVIFLEGGDEPRGEACGPFSPHGFLGCEREAVMAISAWMRMQSANPARANIP
jgi:pimeloyl-ACP methyl ester carboxylesterase